MNVLAYLPLLIAIVGVLVYALAGHAKLQEIGRLSFFAGLFVFLLTQMSKIVRLDL